MIGCGSMTVRKQWQKLGEQLGHANAVLHAAVSVAAVLASIYLFGGVQDSAGIQPAW